MANLSFSREQFVALLDQVMFSDPDDPVSPPAGPVIHEHIQRSLNAGITSVPWRRGPQPDPWAAYPHPDPWRAAAFVASTLNRQLDALQMAQLIAADKGENGIIIVGGKIREIADELCATPPRFRWPWPRPHGLEATELLAAGLTFQHLADSTAGDPIRKNLVEGADVLFRAGIERLGQQTQKAVGAFA